MTRLALRLREESGIAMVLVVFAVALLATLSVVLVDTVASESTRSGKAVVRQTSFEAAESGVDEYIAKLADDSAYYLHWVAPAESTRRDVASSTLVSASGSSPAPSTWCRTTRARPAPAAWSLGSQWDYTNPAAPKSPWDYPNGRDHWCDLGNNFEYSLQIIPPNKTQKGVTIISTGRRINVPTDTRTVEAVVRQSTIADFQEISNHDINWGQGATAYGPIYANHDITWNSGGTAYANEYAVNSIPTSPTWQVDPNTGVLATGFDGSGSTGYGNLFAPPSPLTQPIDFSSFTTSLNDIASAAGDASGGGIYLDSSYANWRLTFNSNGTVTVEGCTGASPAVTLPSCVPVAVPTSGGPTSTPPVPSNGAIYSEQDVIVRGTVKGRVTVATPDQVIIGGNILYEGDASFLNPTYGKNVLGLYAVGNVNVPCWILGDLDWRAALVAQGAGKTYMAQGSCPTGNRQNIPSSSNPDCTNPTNTVMRHRGSAAVEVSGSFSGKFDCRGFFYDDSLTYLPPPWFPTLDPDYNILSFRELPSG